MAYSLKFTTLIPECFLWNLFFTDDMTNKIEYWHFYVLSFFNICLLPFSILLLSVRSIPRGGKKRKEEEEVNSGWPCSSQRRIRHWLQLSPSPHLSPWMQTGLFLKHTGLRGSLLDWTTDDQYLSLLSRLTRAPLPPTPLLLWWWIHINMRILESNMRVCIHETVERTFQHTCAPSKSVYMQTWDLCANMQEGQKHTKHAVRWTITHSHTLRSDRPFRPRHQPLFWGQTMRPRSTL